MNIQSVTSPKKKSLLEQHPIKSVSQQKQEKEITFIYIDDVFFLYEELFKIKYLCVMCIMWTQKQTILTTSYW